MSSDWHDGDPVDVAVVGSGPAGMTAAVAAASAGCSVTVLDSHSAPGGQFHRAHAPGLARRDPTGDRSPPALVAAFRRLADAGNVRVRQATTVWTGDATGSDGAPFRLQLTGLGGPAGDPALVQARTVVLATGATDRVLPFPGWDLPGVFTAGGAQAFLKGQGVLPGRRVVVGGSGPFLLPVAAGLAAAGGQVLQVAEATAVRSWPRHAGVAWTHREKLREATGYLRVLRRHRVPLRTRRAVVRAEGDGRVEQVTVMRLRPDWTARPGTEQTLAVDAVCVSFGFVPQIGLAALLGCEVATDPLWGDPVVVVDDRQETARPGVFAAGEITGVTGSQGAAAEGGLAGLAAAATAGRLAIGSSAARTRHYRRSRAREHRFARVLSRLFMVHGGWTSWLEDGTVVCRCEEVPYGRIRSAVCDLGASDLRSVKLTTRCGMGYCQARMCGASVAAIVARLTGSRPADPAGLSTRPILTPVTLQEVAAAGSDPRHP